MKQLNIEKTKYRYMFMSQKQTAGQIHNIKVVSKSSKNVVKFKCLGKTITNENCKLEKIRSSLTS